jgi:hypothetical protein
MKEDIHARIEKDLIDEVRAWGVQHNLNLTAAIGFLLRRALREEEKQS